MWSYGRAKTCGTYRLACEQSDAKAPRQGLNESFELADSRLRVLEGAVQRDRMQLSMSMGTMTSERRERSRKRPHALVYVELASQNGGMMRDLSEEGFAVRVMMPLRVGETTPFVFSLNESVRIEGEGTILWVQEKGCVAGVQFTRITSAARVQIRGWLSGAEDGTRQKEGDRNKVMPEAPTLEQLREELRASPPRPQTATPVEPVGPPVAETVAATHGEAVGDLRVTASSSQGREGEERYEPEIETEGVPNETLPETSETTANATTAVESLTLEQTASEPMVEQAGEAPQASNEPKAFDAESVAVQPVETVSLASEVVAGVPDHREPPPGEEEVESKDDSGPLETADVSTLFTLIEDQSSGEHSPSPVWPVDGQIPFNTAGAARPDVAGVQSNAESPGAAEEMEGNERREPETQSPPAVAGVPRLPRLALRLNADEASGTKYPFSVGASQTEPVAPGEERPRRFWAATPPGAEQQPANSYAEPTQQHKSEAGEQAANLPDISSILIQPSGASQPPSRSDSSVLEALRPWPHKQPQKKQNWVERFTLSRAIGIMILLVVVVGLYVYRQTAGQTLIWLGEQIGGGQKAQSSQPPSHNNAPTGSFAVAVASDTQQAAQSMRTDDVRPTENRPNPDQKTNVSPAPAGNMLQPPGTKRRNITPPANQTAGSSALAPVVEPNTQAGQAEYQQAMQILQRKYPSYALAEAVKLLWTAVEKGNPSAELALADMYWHGKGVPRNCDQTRILLTAASRKGSAEAQKRLQQFQQEGCE